MARLLHYSQTPITEIVSRKHDPQKCSLWKTPGLWVSVEGEDDWADWCKENEWPIGDFIYEIKLKKDAKINRITSPLKLELFNLFNGYIANWAAKPVLDQGIDWEKIRRKYQGIIIAPYRWESRYSNHMSWYYPWDCASGVIWDATAIESFKLLEGEEVHGEYPVEELERSPIL